MPKGPKTGRLMMACWLREEPQIVEVLGTTENESGYTRFAEGGDDGDAE